jgi:hypothetical protein
MLEPLTLGWSLTIFVPPLLFGFIFVISRFTLGEVGFVGSDMWLSIASIDIIIFLQGNNCSRLLPSEVSIFAPLCFVLSGFFCLALGMIMVYAECRLENWRISQTANYQGGGITSGFNYRALGTYIVLAILLAIFLYFHFAVIVLKKWAVA